MAKLPTDVSAAALSAALAAPAVEKDEFSDAFAKFSAPPEETPKPGAEAVAETLETTAEGEEVQSEIEGAPEPAKEGEEGEKTPEEIKAEADAAKAAAKPKPEPKQGTAEDAITRLADVLTQRQEQKKAPDPAPQPQPRALYTPEETAKIGEFYKEWPEVAPAVEIILKGAMTQVTDRIFTEMARVLGPKMKLLDQVADMVTVGQLKQTIPDYNEDLSERVSEWVKAQPTYLQSAYTNVMNGGTVEEINDLVKRYKAETGTTSPDPDTQEGSQATQPQPKPAASLSTAAKKAAAALAPVNSKRTAVTVGAPQTFDESFDFYANRKAG